MKRRNAEIGKMRRPMKKSKITEGFYGSSTLLYLKFVVLWLLVILADFILEFRFEFLWPFYLLLRSVYDSFKYQGLAFSIFFVCIALTSDMLCFFFIPVHWLFFVASTYVWVQYVWHTDKGICTPTIILWLLFVYLEAAVRLKDVKHLPGHLDLCRPFAAHCIGYPVVTLGFGFKSYIGYRIRQRKQRDVAKENEFYMQLMQQALPVDLINNCNNNSSTTQVTTTTFTATTTTTTQQMSSLNQSDTISAQNNAIVPASSTVQKLHNNKQQQQQEKNGHIPNGTIANGVHHNHHNTTTNIQSKSHRKSLDKCKEHDNEHNNKHTDRQHNKLHNHNNHTNSNGTVLNGTNNDDTLTILHENHTETKQNNCTNITTSGGGNNNNNNNNNNNRRREKREQDKERELQEYMQRLESDTKKLRADLQSSRTSEQELRLQVAALTTSEKVSKGELTSMQRELEDLQQRLHHSTSTRASDKQTINNLERRIAEERRIRSNLESQLNQERKNRKQEEARAAQVAAQSTRGECTEQCKLRRRELENELNECRNCKHWAEERYAILEERYTSLERENVAMAEQLRDTEILMSALSAMQEKNSHLENSLSAENRIKLDLFSALGEAKRQLEIRESANRAQEKEIEELKSKIAQVLAVMPNDTFGTTTNNISRVRLTENPPPGSTLDPNATAYTPKGSLVASTEA